MLILLLSILMTAQMGPEGFGSNNFPSVSGNGIPSGSQVGVFAEAEMFPIPGADITLVPSSSSHPGFGQSILVNASFTYGFILEQNLSSIESAELWVENPLTESGYSLPIDSSFFGQAPEGANVFFTQAPSEACINCEIHLEFEAQNEDGEIHAYSYSSYIQIYGIRQGTVVGNGSGGEDFDFNSDALPLNSEAGLQAGSCSLSTSGSSIWSFLLISLGLIAACIQIRRLNSRKL